MPWKAVGNKIVRKDTGEVVGTSTSHEKAQASVRARYANYKPSKRKPKQSKPSRSKMLQQYNQRMKGV